MSVETYDKQIAQENDHLKRDVNKLELEVNKLKNKDKVQAAQDNRSNMVKKLEKGRTTPKIASQQQRKHLMDEKVEYARSAYFNARRPHIKSEIGYKTSVVVCDNDLE